MTVVNQPEVNINIIPASLEVSNEPQKVLFVGQQNGGTATSGTLTQNIGNQGEEDALFGSDSLIATMIRAARKMNKVTQFDAISLDDAGGATASAGAVVFSGTATEAGTILVTVGSSENSQYSIAVASGDTATVIGDALVTAITADSNALVTAVNTTGSVALTAVNGGTVANSFTLRSEGTVAGAAVAITAMAGGATDPTLTGIFAVVGDERYQTVVWPTGFDLDEVADNFLDPRFNVNNDIQDGVAFTGLTETLANQKIALAAENSESLVFITNKAVSDAAADYEGSAMVELDDVVSSQVAAIDALRLTPGSNISQFVIATNGTLDSFGGPALASMPYFNTTMPFLPLIDIGRGWTKTEIEELLTDGGSVVGNNKASTGTVLGEIATTYKTDGAGNPDLTFKFLNTVRTASAVREYFFNNLKSRFAQSRLTEGDLVPNRSMANGTVIEGYLDKLYQDLAGQDLVLLQAGETALKFFKDNRTVTLDLSTGTVTVTMQVPIVTQLRRFNVTMQIAFSTSS